MSKMKARILNRHFGWGPFIAILVVLLSFSRRTRFLWLTLAAIGGALVWLALRSEPTHLGKPLSYWTERLYELSRPGKGIHYYGTPGYFENVEAIQAIGPAAVPHVLRLLSAEETVLRRLARSALQKMPIKVTVRTAKQMNLEGFFAVKALGDSASNAVPGLITMLRSSSLEKQRFALMALSQVGSPAKEALPLVTNLLRDPRLSAPAFGVVSALGSDAEETLPLLLAILSQSGDDQLRISAANAVRRWGPSGMAALPYLIWATQSSNKVLVTSAQLAIMHLAERTDSFKQALLEIVDGSDPLLAAHARDLYARYFPGLPVEPYAATTELFPSGH